MLTISGVFVLPQLLKIEEHVTLAMLKRVERHITAKYAEARGAVSGSAPIHMGSCL